MQQTVHKVQIVSAAAVAAERSGYNCNSIHTVPSLLQALSQKCKHAQQMLANTSTADRNLYLLDNIICTDIHCQHCNNSYWTHLAQYGTDAASYNIRSMQDH